MIAAVQRWLRCGAPAAAVLVALCVAAPTIAAANGQASEAACQPLAWTVGAGAEHSRWQEFDAQGGRLLIEQGTLGRLDLALSSRCAAIDWQLTLALASGRRGYDGRSSSGAPLSTHSAIDRSALAMAAWLPVADGWSMGGQLVYRQLRRNIASAGPVSGYAEVFSDSHALALLRHQSRLGGRLGLTAELGLGAGPPGRLALQLPYADAAVLRLGASRLLQAGLGLRLGATAEPASSWQLQLSYRAERFAAGRPQVLLRHGQVVGGAAQPETRQSALGLQAGHSF